MTDNAGATGRQSDVALELFAAGFDDPVEIGRGGFGVVYRCVQEDLDRTVAVKVVLGDLDREGAARFVREQRAMGRLSGHPNIVELYQVGVTRTGRPFLVMPYHPHGSLDARIRGAGPLSWEAVLRLGIKIAGALETAHRRGTLHRDVKPANILLTDYDEPQLSDFGIARVAGGFETTAGAIVCSPAYTAPEVLEGQPPTAASDVYGLGSTLFCALTGHAAFERQSGEHVVAQFLRVASRPIPDLRVSGIPAEVCAAVERAMARPLQKRPPSAAEFGEELRQIQRRNGSAVDDMRVLAEPAPSVSSRTGDGIPDRVVGSRARARGGRAVSMPPAPVTKFRPPTTNRHLVRRDRLLSRLRAGGENRLVFVHGPAGCGKSTLAAQWRDELAADGIAVAWLTVDADDNNVVWFLSHLTEAIRRVRSEVVGDLGQALEENGEAVKRYVLTSLINRIHDAAQPLAVVIDDWHWVTAPEPIAALEFLLDNASRHLRFVVVGRSGAGLPLSRLRVRDELSEIDSEALGFDAEESRSFFVDRLPNRLADTEIEKLRAVTGGWVAALQLASLSLRETGGPVFGLDQFGPATDSLSAYLTENVLNALDPEILDFLLVTAVPDRICGQLASALAGVVDGQARLEQISSHDLFLGRTGEDRQWFRYHHLFVQVLRQRLERHDPRRLTSLHRKASEWFRERHLLAEALGHLLAAGDVAAAVTMLEEDSRYLLDRSQMATLLGLIAKLPAAAVLSSPGLQLAIGWANTELERRDVAIEAHRRAADLLGLVELSPERREQLRVEAAVLQACILSAADRVAGVKQLLAECLADPATQHPFVVSMAALLDTIADVFEFRFADAARRQRWAAPYHSRATGPYLVTYGYCNAGIARAEQLDFSGAMELYRNALQLVEDAGNTQSQHARLARVLLAEALYLQDRVAEATDLLNETLDVVAFGGAPDFMIRYYCLNARIRCLHGDRTGAAALLEEGNLTGDALSLPRLSASVDLERIRLGFPVRPGYVAIAGPTHRRPADGIEQLTAELNEETAITLLLRTGDAARVRLAGDWAHDRLCALAGSDRALARLHAARLRVQCMWAAGRFGDAEAAVLPVVSECARTGLIRFLVDGGPDVVAALTSARTHTVMDAPVRTFADTVLAAQR